MIPTPIELLQRFLNGLKRDLTRSEEMLEDNVIFPSLHEMHRKNLEPKIKEFELAITKLLE